MAEPGTPRLLRAINDRAVLDLLLRHGPLTRPRLGELTRLSKPTMSQVLARLEAQRLVRASGSTSGRPGPNAALYEIDPSAAYVGGLDVTPRRIRAAVADVTGAVVATYELPTPRRGSADTVQRVVTAVDGVCEAAGLERQQLHHLVIGTPGAFDPGTGRLRYARHLPGWHDPELLPLLAATLRIPVVVDNDVNLAAVGELSLGVARGSDDFVLLWCDEGVGAAVVIDGRLHRGHRGGAGEVGFLPVPGAPLVRHVTVTNAGGFQELVGAKAVVALAKDHGIRSSTAVGAVTTAAKGDGHDGFLNELASRLAVGLAAVVSVLDPELVVLAGGILHAGGDQLLERITRELRDLTVSPPPVSLSAVADDPVLMGALHTALLAARNSVFNTTDTSAGGRTAAD